LKLRAAGWLAALAACAIACSSSSGCALICPPDALHPDAAVAVVHSAAAGPLLVGAAKVEITPDDSLWIPGRWRSAGGRSQSS